MANTLNYHVVPSPLGPLRLLSNGRALVRIEFPEQHGEDGVACLDAVLAQTARELKEYFSGSRRSFDVPLAAGGTPFQHRVWEALRAIPYGELRSYRDIADSLGNRQAVRAVGAANGRNPIPVIVPCHRVVGSNGRLTGFAGGLAAKRTLLELEGLSGDWSR
jgi:methylated-DNA-[protein]-cysteine S-methyltransferase